MSRASRRHETERDDAIWPYFLVAVDGRRRAVTGVVKDSTGGAVAGRDRGSSARPSGAEQQTVTGPDGRFTLDDAPTAAATLVVRAGGFAESSSRSTPIGATSRSSCRRPAIFETVIVTPTRSEQRLGDVPGERQRARPANRSRPRRPSWPTTCCARFRRFSLFRRTSSLVGAADDAGRVAARHRAERPEPHARAARRRAVQRSVRRLGLLDARAAR